MTRAHTNPSQEVTVEDKKILIVEIEYLGKKLEELQNQVKSMNDLTDQVKTLDSSRLEKEKAVKDLTDSISALNDQKKALEQVVMANVAQKSAELAEKEQLVGSKQEEHDDLHCRIEQLMAANAALLERSKALDAEIADKTKSIEFLVTKTAAYEAQFEQVKGKLEKVQAETTENMAQAGVLELRIKELDEQVALKTVEFDRIHDSMVKTTSDIAEARKQAASIRAEADLYVEATKGALQQREAENSLKEANLTDREARLRTIKQSLEKIHGKPINI